MGTTKIGIPSPCGEDWNSMTPTEKGAFCDKCAFEVIDFTQQSPEEIRDTLKSRMRQKTCGHISRTQIDMVNTNYHIWENQSISTFRSKFLYACAMVFGMTLFTGCELGTEPEHEVGDVEQEVIDGGMEIDMGMVEEDTTYDCSTDMIEGEIEMGDVEYIEDEVDPPVDCYVEYEE